MGCRYSRGRVGVVMKHRLPFTYKGFQFDIERVKIEGEAGGYFITSPQWRGMTAYRRSVRSAPEAAKKAIDEYLEFMADFQPDVALHE